MIWESSYYKEELLEIAQRLDDRTKFRRWTDKSLFLLEKDVFVAFYIIRKLVEAKTKLPTVLSNQRVELEVFLSNGKNVTLFNNHRLCELFNMNKSQKELKKLGFVCNQIIHSYVMQFDFCYESKGLAGIYFCSDKYRNEKLYRFDISLLIELLIQIGNNGSVIGRFKYNDKIRDYDCYSE